MFVYILKCNDRSFYTGVTNNIERRILEHHEGRDPMSYTYSRRPVELVYSHECDNPMDTIQIEKQIKGWSRAKKKALIENDWNALRVLARCHPSTRSSG